MSLKEDIETMRRYEEMGLLREYLLGTAPPLSEAPMPLDDSRQEGLSGYELISRRGD